MKYRGKLLTIFLGCFVAAIMLLTFITSGCNSISDIALSPEEIEALPIYTQADMDKILGELDDCLNSQRRCPICPNCPEIPECPPCRENCYSNCRVEQYTCIYQCTAAGNTNCIEQCHDLFIQCQEECPAPCPICEKTICKPKNEIAECNHICKRDRDECRELCYQSSKECIKDCQKHFKLCKKNCHY
jgi:hypothetical protein